MTGLCGCALTCPLAIVTALLLQSPCPGRDEVASPAPGCSASRLLVCEPPQTHTQGSHPHHHRPVHAARVRTGPAAVQVFACQQWQQTVLRWLWLTQLTQCSRQPSQTTHRPTFEPWAQQQAPRPSCVPPAGAPGQTVADVVSTIQNNNRHHIPAAVNMITAYRLLNVHPKLGQAVLELLQVNSGSRVLHHSVKTRTPLYACPGSSAESLAI